MAGLRLCARNLAARFQAALPRRLRAWPSAWVQLRLHVSVLHQGVGRHKCPPGQSSQQLAGSLRFWCWGKLATPWLLLAGPPPPAVSSPRACDESWHVFCHVHRLPARRPRAFALRLGTTGARGFGFGLGLAAAFGRWTTAWSFARQDRHFCPRPVTVYGLVF